MVFTYILIESKRVYKSVHPMPHFDVHSFLFAVAFIYCSVLLVIIPSFQVVSGFPWLLMKSFLSNDDLTHFLEKPELSVGVFSPNQGISVLKCWNLLPLVLLIPSINRSVTRNKLAFVDMKVAFSSKNILSWSYDNINNRHPLGFIENNCLVS